MSKKITTLALVLGLGAVFPLVGCDNDRGSDFREEPGEVFEENVGEPLDEGTSDIGREVEDATD